MSAEPMVSVVIPTYSRLAKLKRAVESAIDQTYDHIELIVVDDFSHELPCENIIDLIPLGF